MNQHQHISESRLAEAGMGDGALTGGEVTHTRSCVACRALLHRYERLRERIDDLPVVADASSALWLRVAAEQGTHVRHRRTATRPGRPSRHHAARLAMAAGLLAVGFLGGRLASGSPPAGVDEGQSQLRRAWQGSDAALRVQWAGTEYLAALVNLSSAVADPVTRRQGREAALAAMYGAALEMTDGIRDDDALRRVATLVHDERARARVDTIALRDQGER